MRQLKDSAEASLASLIGCSIEITEVIRDHAAQRPSPVSTAALEAIEDSFCPVAAGGHELINGTFTMSAAEVCRTVEGTGFVEHEVTIRNRAVTTPPVN